MGIRTKIRRQQRDREFKNMCKAKHISIADHVEYGSGKLGEYCNIAHHASVFNSNIGKRTSIGRYSKLRDCTIGSYCSISWDVTIGAVSHPMDRVTSHAFSYRKQFGLAQKDIYLKEERTTIGHDVWIGCGAIILSGLTIGNGAVIGAGAVVTKDVEPYSIVAGVPAKNIGMRFEPDMIEKIQKLAWWEKSDEYLKERLGLFEQRCSDEIIRKLEENK